MEENELKKYVPGFDLSLYDTDSLNAFRGHFLDCRIINAESGEIIEIHSKVSCFQNLRIFKGEKLCDSGGKLVMQLIFNSKYVYNPDPQKFTTPLDALYWYIDILKEMGFDCTLNSELLEYNSKINYVVTLKPNGKDTKSRSIARMFLTHQALRMIYDVHNIEAVHNFYWLYNNYDYKSKGFTLYQLFQAAIMITEKRTFPQKVYWTDSYGGQSTNKNGSFMYSSTCIGIYTHGNLENAKAVKARNYFNLTILYDNLETFLDNIPEPNISITKTGETTFHFHYSDTIAEFFIRKLENTLDIEYILNFLSQSNIEKLLDKNKEIKKLTVEEAVTSF
jgi:hypothetical protein